MTQTAINRQIEVIQQASANASKSKKSALKFLVDAGIIKSQANKTTSTTIPKKHKK